MKVELRCQRRGMPLSLIPNMAAVTYIKVTCKPAVKVLALFHSLSLTIKHFCLLFL